MIGFLIFIMIVIVVLYGFYVSESRSASELQRRVDRLVYRARENESRLGYYRKEIDRRQEHSRRSAEEITRMAVQYEVEQERAAGDARLKNARDAAEAIRARIGGKA